jgi:hypothetical protein
MDGLRADDQGVHIQHAFESLNDVGNWAPAGEGGNRTIGIRPQGRQISNPKNLKPTASSQNLRKTLACYNMEASQYTNLCS